MDEGLEKTMLGVRLWRHAGVWSPKNKTNVYCKDGVHLSHLCETQGNPKYCNSVRASVVSGFNSLQIAEN